MFVTKEKQKTAILLGASTESKEIILKSLVELERLADTADIKVVGICYQSFKEKTKATYIGSGKVEELKNLVSELKPDMVIVDEMIKGFQLRNLSEAVGVDVIDRYMLILDIFAKRATTAEGKLQVEIAKMKYNMSRISLIKENDERFRGGIGSKGPGEKKVEIEKRIYRNNLKILEDKLKEITKNRGVTRSKRTNNREKIVVIVGYTNAGKSTLLNALAKDNIYADDKLFATLETTTRKIYLDYKHYFLLIDTVGFINKLPHDLVEAFQSTLEEVKSADCILHVVDASDKNCIEQMNVTQGVLEKLEAQNIPKILVLNKTDCCQDMSIFESMNYVPISAKNNENLELLKQKISEILFPDFEYIV